MQRLTTMALTATLLGAPLAAQDDAADQVAIMVFDASGSMWNRLEGDLTRIEIARDVMEDFFHSRDTTIPLAVVAYGHRQRGACSDIETIAPLARHDGAALTTRLRALNPQGMTPLTDAMALARDMIPPTAESADLILVTDGLENCGGDPCALAAELAAQGIGIRAHVVGFGMTEDEINTLSCLPEQTGGMLFQTNSGAELAQAMTAVSTPEPQPVVVEAPPEIEVAESELPEAAISGPDSVRTGESFRVQWSDPINDRDIVAIVPMGADEGELGTWSRVGGSSTQTDLRAPSDAGMYELRYILDEGRRTLASASIEVIAVEVDVSGPETVRAGDTVRVSWSDRVHDRDIVTIVPMGAAEGELGDWARVGGATMQRDFDASEETGMYEVRYILDEGRVTLGRHIFEVVDAMAPVGDGVMLSVPATASPGETITVTWSGGTDGANQRIALARSDQALFTWVAAQPIEELSEITFTLPDDPGFYEIRFLDLSAQEVLSRARLEVR